MTDNIATPRVEAVIEAAMKRFKGIGDTASARYYEKSASGTCTTGSQSGARAG
jgi:hypothetical protein